jgi:hypothetical protein
MQTHDILNQIFDFLGGCHSHNWDGSDSPLNVSSMQYVDYYDPYNQDLEDRLVVNAGNSFFSENAKGAYVYGFRLFRDLLDHFKIPQPRRLKGEGPRPREYMKLTIKKQLYEKLRFFSSARFAPWHKGVDVSLCANDPNDFTTDEIKALELEFSCFFGENSENGPWRFIIGGNLYVELYGDELICHWFGGGGYRKGARIDFTLVED